MSVLKRMMSSSAAAAPAVEYSKYFTSTSLRRLPSPIRALQPLVSLPGMISLGGGMPNPALFPFKGMSLTFDDGKTFEVPKKSLDEALQYSPTPGLPELVERITRMQTAEHKPPRPFQVTITPGSQCGLALIFDAIVGEKDTVLVESPTYSGSLAYLQAIGCKFAGVATDGDGLVPEKLEELLEGWDEAKKGSPKPRVLYSIPTGSNPTGGSLTEERKRKVYALAVKHGLLIIEDDPYYYLSYADARGPSFFSMDTHGIVVRSDSYSKVLSAGIRVGVVTGPEAIVNRVNLHAQASYMHTSGVSQMLTLQLFKHWKAGEPASTAGAGAAAAAAAAASSSSPPSSPALGGLEDHLVKVRSFYRAQCEAFCAGIEKHLRANKDGSGELLVEYSPPKAGMFIWMRLKGDASKGEPLRGVEDTMELITKKAVENKVLMVPGSAFYPAGSGPSSYVRASFSTASPAEIDTALQRFGDLLRSMKKA